MNKPIAHIEFPTFQGIRCLMMPFIQGDPNSLPTEYQSYCGVIASVYVKKGDVGFLTIDESKTVVGKPHRGARAKYGRALHTEGGKRNCEYGWGSTTIRWGDKHAVMVDRDVQVLLANNLDGSCAVWDAEHEDTSFDGDIGNFSSQYPYETATFMQGGDVHMIGILTPHESIPVKSAFNRQFLRIVSSGVHGREPYFTENPLVSIQ
jgi:hypothetical protein